MGSMALERLGCSQDPNRWDCSHVTAAVEERLRVAKSKHLGAMRSSIVWVEAGLLISWGREGKR